ncbi:hypothetical protein O181_060886 [Austropuccinia psidii MF-1]|uniref:Uncharacterized protein n=1 Tax=Austropuccinia psidii MF-1 TaxID=1389203 RepID=A0A9Q3HX05_9BASI|nr:hypothetical protein [Austropuccinia psidii MF-1]
MQSKPEDFINADGPSNWAPINHPRPPLQQWGRSYFLWSWTQAMWVIKWSHGPPRFPAYGSILALGALVTPTDHRKPKEAKGPRRPKKTHTGQKGPQSQNHQNGHSRGQKTKFEANSQVKWGQAPSLDEEDPR